MLGAVLLYVAVFCTTIGSGLREYDPNVGVDIYTTEKPYDWETPRAPVLLLPYFSKYKVGAKYMGQLIAGRAEFPWVVDVRVEGLDQEAWAIGNLVSGEWVVTVCHIIQKWDDKCKLFQPEEIEVLFCTNYINEDYSRYNEHDELLYHLVRGADSAGRRHISGFQKHPKCDCDARAFDVALLRLNVPIPSILPVVAYAPVVGVNEDYSGRTWQIGSITSKLEIMNKDRTRMVCYVASFGRRYKNLWHPRHLDYKVKYRVYYAGWRYCNSGDRPDQLCTKGSFEKDTKCLLYLRVAPLDVMCFRTHATHGAVCGHDSGAPVVCNGEVFGIVVRGVDNLRCNNRLPMPFIIAKINVLNGLDLSGKHSTPWVESMLWKPVRSPTRKRLY